MESLLRNEEMHRTCARILITAAVLGMENLCCADEPETASTPSYPVAPDQPCADCSANNSRHSYFGYFDRRAPIGPMDPECDCCGTFWSDCRFIFGTCQDFFGDPGLRIPPALIHYPHTGQ
jgi:hypothetical protein